VNAEAGSNTDPDAPELLRTRLVLLGKVGVSIALPFNVVGIALDLLPGDRTLGQALVAVDNVVPMLVTLVLAALWKLPPRLSLRGLLALDFGFLPLVDALFLWAASHIETTPPAPLATLAFVFAALGRAIVVPSSPRRTLVATAVGALPTALGAWSLLEAVGSLRVPQTAITILWHAGAVVLSTVTSSVIYGLRREVNQARKLGQYTLLRRIGAGGMGEVYLASHALLRRPTAVKLLRAGKGGRAHFERFEREVQLTSQLSHPNTISVYDYGRTPDGTFYYAMEYLEGLTLQELGSVDGPQPAARVVRLIHSVCDALSEAHDVGLIHRDIKPANIFVCERGGRADVVKVMDFGLVKSLDGLEPSVTATNAVIGTPLYLSPESIDRPSEIDARSDLYAVGCVAYFLLTGEPPFHGASTIEVCLGHLHTAPTPPSERVGEPISAELEALILECLAKRPEERPQTARQICERLASLPEFGAWTEADALAWWERAGRALRSRREPATLPPDAATIVDVLGREPVQRGR
jgi:serine/threonine-protein kinase